MPNMEHVVDAQAKAWLAWGSAALSWLEVETETWSHCSEARLGEMEVESIGYSFKKSG